MKIISCERSRIRNACIPVLISPVLFINGCHKATKKPENMNTNEPCEWPVVLEVANVNGKIVKDHMGIPGYEITGFDLTLPGALNHLYPCNLADSLKTDGLNIRFNGKIRYQDNTKSSSSDIGSLPVTLTSIEF